MIMAWPQLIGAIRHTVVTVCAAIAMHKGDRPPARLPSAVVENRVPVVPWNQQAIMKAIKRATA